jgi:hypothetical protein
VELLKKLPQSAALGNNMCHNLVLCLGTGVGDCSLSHGRLRDEVVAEVDAVARSGTLRVGAACPIRIRVCSEGLGRTILT